MFQILAYIGYWLKAVDEHSLHSPFLFKFYNQVVKNDVRQGFERIEELRDSLLKNQNQLTIDDLGAGSRINKSNKRRVSEIARHSSTPPDFSRLLHRIITYFGYSNVIELGTSLGLNSIYMASVSPQVKITTFEGANEIASLALGHFEALNVENIQMIEGNIDDTLKNWLQSSINIDLVYMDANHRYSPTMEYFNWLLPKMKPNGMIIIDDIHWSKEMSMAWNHLRVLPEVSLSLDVFEAGILFLDQHLTKEHYVLRF